MATISKLITLSVLGFTTACAPVAAAPETAVVAPATMPTVSYTISSWGKPQRVWTLAGDGAVLVETKKDGQGYANYDMEQRRAVLTPDQAAEVRDGLSVARGPLPHCTVILTDGPSIFVTWDSPQPEGASVYMGCREEAFRPIIARLMAADAIVAAAVASAPVSGLRRVP